MRKRRRVKWKLIGIATICIGFGMLLSMLFPAIGLFYALNIVVFGFLLILSK